MGSHFFKLTNVDAFSKNYSQARQRFRTAVQQLGWQLEEFAITGKTPEGEELMVDVGLSSDGTNGGPSLIVSSGLHGVEGFFGSAVQLHLLDAWKRTQTPKGIRMVFLNALNPYGFAWVRRFDASNVDLNRNFLLPGETYRGAPALYAQLDSLLNPKRPVSSPDFILHHLAWHILRHGFKAVQAAIASGQYDFPQGLFFGGHQPSELSTLLGERLAGWVANSERVMHLDLHTGLGKYAEPLLLLDSPLSDRHRAELVAWFGERAFRDVRDEEGFYQARGSFGRWCHSQSAVEDYLYCCAEFGTYSPIRVALALRSENQSYHWSSSDAEAVGKTKEKLMEVFCPRSPRWRQRVLAKAQDLTTRAIEGLQAIR